MNNPATNTYIQQQLTTASPVKVVAMLYDRAIGSLREAIEHIENKKPEARWKANKRAQDIILQLHNTLDMEKGGIISENLDKLYTSMLLRLPDVDIRNDPRPAQEAITILTPLRDAWHELARQVATGQIDAAAEMQKAEQQFAQQTPAATVQKSPSPQAAVVKPSSDTPPDYRPLSVSL